VSGYRAGSPVADYCTRQAPPVACYRGRLHLCRVSRQALPVAGYRAGSPCSWLQGWLPLWQFTGLASPVAGYRENSPYGRLHGRLHGRLLQWLVTGRLSWRLVTGQVVSYSTGTPNGWRVVFPVVSYCTWKALQVTSYRAGFFPVSGYRAGSYSGR
jgi:hypothetical protein